MSQQGIQPDCPVCMKVLERVRYEGGYLNEDQFDSVRAGDWWVGSTAPVKMRFSADTATPSRWAAPR